VDTCSIEYLNAIDCAVSKSPNPDVVAPCATFCTAVADAKCTNTPTPEACNSNCLWAGATGIGCDQQWKSYLACANSSPLTCSLLGYAKAPGCGVLLVDYTKCINAAS
jgi:hypothetical protein